MNRSHQTKWTCLASAAIKWRWYLDADRSFAFDIVHRVHLCKIAVVICSLNSFDVGKRFVLYSVFWFIHISEFQTIYMFVMFDMGIAAPPHSLWDCFLHLSFSGWRHNVLLRKCVRASVRVGGTDITKPIHLKSLDGIFPIEVPYLVRPIVAPHVLIHGPKTCQIWRQWDASFAECISLKPLDGLSLLEVLWSCLVVECYGHYLFAPHGLVDLWNNGRIFSIELSRPVAEQRHGH